MEKKYLTILLTVLLSLSLVACGSDDVEEPQKNMGTVEENREVEEVQEVEEESIKSKAIEEDFIEINGGRVEEATAIHLTAKIDVFMGDDGVFNEILVSTKKEGVDGFGMYMLKHVVNADFEYIEDEMIEVWGVYSGKSDNGIPEIVVVIVENSDAKPF